MSLESFSRSATRVTVLLLFLAVVALAVWRLDDDDTWWHLASGRLIVAEHVVPTHDPFSYTASTRPWIDLQWMFQLALFGAYVVAGIPGVTLMTAACAVVVFAILYRIVRPAGRLAATSALLLTLLVTYERFMVRPEIASLVLFAWYLALLEAYPANGRWVWLIVPLQALWVNVHALFVTGLVLVFTYAVGRTLMWLWNRGDGALALRRLWCVAGGALAACWLNPYGTQGALFPLTLLTRFTTQKALYGIIGEFQGPFSSVATPAVRVYALLIVLTVATFVGRWRALRVDRLCAWAAFLALSIMARRNMGFFALVATPIVAEGLAGLGRFVTQRTAGSQWSRGLTVTTASVLSVALAALIFLVVTNRFYWSYGDRREFGLGVSSIDCPIGAVDFLERAQIGGNRFNDVSIGGYLIWRGAEAHKVFIDGRLEVYDEQFFARYVDALREPRTFDALAEQYAVTHVVLSHVWGNRRRLIEHLVNDERWALVYLDETVVIFIRNLPEYTRVAELGGGALRRQLAGDGTVAAAAATANGWLGSLVWPVHAPYAHLQKGNLLLLLDQTTVAGREFEQALAIHPDFHAARVGLGYALWSAGKPDAARAEWQRVLAADPHFGPALEALALARAQGG